MSEKIKKLIFGLLFIAGALTSFLTIESYVGQALGLEESSFCNMSASFNCAAASASEFATFFGFPLGSYGVLYYLAALAFLFSGLVFKRFSFTEFLSLLLPLSVISAFISVFLFSVSLISLGSICPLCFILYVLSFIQLYLNLKFVSGSLKVKTSSVVSAYSSFVFTFFGCVKALDFKSLVEYLVMLLIFAQVVFLGVISPKIAASRLLSDIKDWPYQQKITEGIELGEGIFADYYSGKADAPIQIVEFLDYECPFCKRFNSELKDLLINYEGLYSLIIKSYPLDISCNSKMTQSMHTKACDYAEVARCAGEQGQFMSIHNQILEIGDFEGINIFADESPLKEIIEKSGLDLNALNECLQSNRQLDRVKKDISLGGKLNIRGTPAMWINGKEVRPLSIARVEKILKFLKTKRSN